MSQTHASHQPTNTITQNNISTRLENSITELQNTPHVLSVTRLPLTNLERSVFYRDDHKRVYQLNPREHPGIVGVFDTIFTEMAETQDIDASRSDARSGYLVTISTSCDACQLHSTDCVGEQTDEQSIYPATVTEQIMDCPFKDTQITCSDAIHEERFSLHRSDTDELIVSNPDCGASDLPVETLTFFPEARKTGTGTECNNHALDKNTDCEYNPVPVESITIGQLQASSSLAKLIGVLDVIEYVRTHPTVQNGMLNRSRVEADLSLSTASQKSLEKFKECCDEFLLETAPGWRLRWILEVVTDKHRPVSNIANAANVSHEEARITMSLLHEWGILSGSEELGQDKYKLDESYAEWRENIPETGFEHVEPVYLMQNQTPTALVNNAYIALSDIHM